MNEMTTRGTNPSSISPPVQIPQSRHVSTIPIPSGTPPPNQQLYPGQSPGLIQGPTLSYIQPQYQQGEQLFPFQAYGSAPNDLRGATSSSGRGGAAGTSNMAQSGTYYHQANQNMRPSQPPPPNHSQQFYINQGAQNSMRHSRHVTSNPPMYIVPNNNMVIPANMYQPTTRVPVFPQGGTQFPRYNQPSGVMYFNGVQRSSVPMQTQGMGPPPAPREKRFISISDPTTGRNITDEIIKSSHSQSSDDKSEPDESFANDKAVEIKKIFTRQVVERMKTAEASPSPNQSPAESIPTPPPMNPPPQNQPSQEHPQMPTFPPGPPQQPQSTPPLTGTPGPPGSMMRPPMMMANPAINLSVPPPQLPPNMVYNNARHAPNQQTMQGQVPIQPPQHVIPPKGHPPPSSVSVAVVEPEPSLRSVEPSVIPVAHDLTPAVDRKAAAQVDPVIPQSDIPAQKESATDSTSIPPVHPIEKFVSREAAPLQDDPSQSLSHQKASIVPQDRSTTSVQVTPVQIPVEETATQVSTPVEQSSAPTPVSMPQPEPVASTTIPTHVDTQQSNTDSVVEPNVAVNQPATAKQTTEPSAKPTVDADVSAVKEETGTGASTQGSKDGRKGKKNKKDFSRKESGGSEMDAFIDGKDSGVESEPSRAIQDQRKLSESKPQEKALTPPLISDNVPQEIKKEKDQSPVPPTPSLAVESPTEVLSVKELKADKYISEKETEVVKPDIVQNQNGTDLPQGNKPQMELEASVPNDSPTVNPVPEEIPPDIASDNQSQVNDQHDDPEENGSTMVEEIEPSKAEMFAKLKKSGGKLVYDRAYLLELRDCSSSQTKPDGLPALDIILDNPPPFMPRPSAGPADFTPAFFQTGTNQRHAPPIGKSSSRGRSRPGDMSGTPRVIKSISMSHDTKTLHQSENPWKPSKKEDKEGKGLEGEILFIMNRLTPTNFEKMANEMKQLNVKTYKDLQFMVKVFFEKVTLETKFVQAYAQLCKVMSGLKVTPPTDGSVKENMATFRVVMLTKCQQEFEADKSIVFEDPEEKKKKLEAENPEKTPERDDMIEKTLYHMKLKRMKFYGNIRFIGELFKLNMLTENIMHDCIFRLLKARDDDSLVSLCNLLTTVGRNLDIEKAKPRMDQYFSQMVKIADERKSRIKFTLRDVIELRQNNWVPRKETTGPKKIDEVHKDYAQEQLRNQYLASQPPPPRNDNQPGSRRGSRQRQDDKTNEDGWNTVSSKSVRMIDASKMKISKNVMVDDNIQLGPGGGAHKPVWSRGSHGGTQPSQDDRPAVGSNRFSALGGDDGRRSYPRSPSRGEGSAGRGLRQGQTAGHGRGKIMARSSQEGERRDAIANARSFMGGRSQNSSRENSWNRDDRRQLMGPRSSYERDNPMTRSDSAAQEFRAPAPPAVKQMSESEIETKAVNILDEYLNIRDLAEAKLCMKELAGQNHLYLVVTACINSVLEKKDTTRHMTGDLFHEIVGNNIIALDIYVKGLNEVLQYASDMVVDIPTLWNCLAQVILPLLVGGSLPWSKLKQAFTPYLDNKDGAKLMASLLSQCVEKQGEKQVVHQWQNSGLSWSTYLKQDELSSFVADKKLDFTLGTGSNVGILPDLEEMIHAKASNSDLISYIEKTVSGSKTDSSFIRALTTAFVSSSITDKKSVNEDVIKNHKDVLQRYLGSKVDLQLQALYAIQTLMAKLEHPSGVLLQLFELFYYEISVEEEALYRWEKCNDPQEQESKGTCLMQVRQFFTYLRENEEPES